MVNTYICHHGIKGQKWGVRRYQNENGTLTPEGEKRYLNEDGTLTKKGIRRLHNDEFTRSNAGSSRLRDKAEIRSRGLKEAQSKKMLQYGDRALGLNRIKNNPQLIKSTRKKFANQYAVTDLLTRHKNKKVREAELNNVVDTYRKQVDELVKKNNVPVTVIH